MLQKIKDFDIPREYLEFEVTETIFYDDVEFIINKLRQLRAKGHKVSMDDFGSGYSSLNTVGLMPIDIIKFDRGFVQNSINNQKGLDIMTGLVDIFNKINLEVICEGVETAEEEKTVQQCGCDYVQGYYHDRPLPIAEFESKYMRR
jgi:EAL domain-containing protein (putative c-di-GMP-specific phosphodiesterase class I)